MKKRRKVKSLKYDLACGQNKQEGFIGVDIAKGKGVDIVWDLEKYPWKFAKDNSVDEVVISHYVEHVKDLNRFMDELYRILKPVEFDKENPNKPIRGFATIDGPYYSSMRAWQDPTHVRALSEATFLYFNKKWREDNKLDHYPVKCDFDFTYGYNMYPDWAMKSEEAKMFAIKHYNNVVSDIHVVLMKKHK